MEASNTASQPPAARPMRAYLLKRFRQAVFVLICLATLVGLFYAEENIRGKYEWGHYVEAGRSRGIELDWHAYVPAPVPDDENFAMAPLFAGFFDYQHVDHRIVWRDTNIWPSKGNFAFQGDAPWGKQPAWLDGRPLELKQWQDYFRTPQKAHPHLWAMPAQPGEPARDILLALQKFGPELDGLREAAKRPMSRFPIHYEELPEALLPHLAYLVHLAEASDLRACAELALGDYSSAFADTMLGFRCTDGLDSEAFEISQWVRCRIFEKDLQAVWEGLRGHNWTESQIEGLQRYFAMQDLLGRFSQMQKANVAFTCGWIDLLSSEPEIIGLTQENNPVFAGPLEGALEGHLWPRGWISQNKLSLARFYYQTISNDVDAASQRVYPELSATNAGLFMNLSPGAYNFAFVRVWRQVSPERFAQVQTELNLAVLACALERYRMAQGSYPETLAALSPHFLEQAPHDIINGEPLKYRKTGEDTFILYSVGWNQRDDGGAPPAEDPAAVQNSEFYHAEKGDWVWRYSNPTR